MKFYLIGFMGCGKTFVINNITKLQPLKVVDLDAYIEQKEGIKISQIFAEKGENEFRAIEKKALESLVNSDFDVISVGGGTPCFLDNIERMNETGTTIYLKCSEEVLQKRLSQSTNIRPLIAEKPLLKTIRSLMKDREGYYSKAQFTVNADCDPTEEILNIINNENLRK